MTVDRLDIILNGDSSNVHKALVQTIESLEKLNKWAITVRKNFEKLEQQSYKLTSGLGAVTGISSGAAKVVVKNYANQINNGTINANQTITNFDNRIDNSVRNITRNIGTLDRHIDRSVHNTTNNISNMGNVVTQTAGRVNSGISSMLKSFAGLYAVGKIFQFVKQSMVSGMDTIESESLFETSLSDMSDMAREWSKDLSDQLGLNAVELRKNVGILYTMTTSMGIADKSAYEMSTNLAKLANDMASYYNLTTEEAFIKLRSGLTGETEPLKALGILVDVATIKQYAYENGIAETGKQLTQQQKVMARYMAILDQTNKSQGDLARTIESPANQLRILKTRFEEMAQVVGAEFQPLLKVVFPALSQMIQSVTPHISAFAKGISSVAVTFSMLNAPVKNALKISLASIIALGNLNKIYNTYLAVKKASMILAFGEATANTMNTASTTSLTIAKGLLSKVYNILIPKVLTFSTVLKASLGWIGLVAGAVALLYSVFWKKKKTVDDSASSMDNFNNRLKDVGNYNFDLSDDFRNTSDSVDDTSDSIKDLKKQVSVAGFDEINTLSFDTEGEELVNLDTDDVDNYSNALSDLDSQIDSMMGGMNFDLEEYDLSGLFNLDGLDTVKNTFLDWVDETFGSDARNKVEDFFLSIEEIPNATSQMFDDMMNDGGIFNLDSNFWDNWIAGAEELTKSFENMTGGEDGWGAKWNGFWEKKGSDFFSFKSGIVDGIKDMKDWWSWWIDSAVTSWIDGLENMGEKIFKWTEDLKIQLEMVSQAIKGVFSGEVFKEDFSVAGYFGQIVAGTSAKINGYATGGFPDYGELFIARENGVPEMVGTMGNSTAVANNSQIVEGISQGVYEAVTTALQQNSNSNQSGNITIPVYLFKGSSEMSRIVVDSLQLYNAMTGGYM